MGKTTRSDRWNGAQDDVSDETGLAETARVLEDTGKGDLPAQPEPPTPPTPPAPAPLAAPPEAAAPEPLWAPHEHIPQEGGSYVRQNDGSLLRTEEEEA